ncbi:hypothetical protein Tco_1182848 [Tanacetum coccineum]
MPPTGGESKASRTFEFKEFVKKYRVGGVPRSHVRTLTKQVFKTFPDTIVKGSQGESFWEEGDDFGVDVLCFYTCLTDILGFLEKLEWWFEQDIDDEGEEDKEGERGSEV